MVPAWKTRTARKTAAARRKAAARAALVRIAPAAALALAFSQPGLASDLTLSLPGDAPVQRVTAGYACPGIGAVTVEYLNAGDAAIAVLPVDGKTLVFANVLAASGARYAAGPYIWWTKGNTAALYDLRKGDDAEPVNCAAK